MRGAWPGQCASGTAVANPRRARGSRRRTRRGSGKMPSALGGGPGGLQILGCAQVGPCATEPGASRSQAALVRNPVGRPRLASRGRAGGEDGRYARQTRPVATRGSLGIHSTPRPPWPLLPELDTMPGASVRGFLEKGRLGMSGWRKAHGLPWWRWASSNQSKARLAQS